MDEAIRMKMENDIYESLEAIETDEGITIRDKSTISLFLDGKLTELGYRLIDLDKLKVLDINTWLDSIGCDRAYKKDMKATFGELLPHFQAQLDDIKRQLGG